MRLVMTGVQEYVVYARVSARIRSKLLAVRRAPATAVATTEKDRPTTRAGASNAERRRPFL